MKMIRFSETFWHTLNGASVPQFEKGKDYPADDEEARRCIARGIAAEVDVPDPEPPKVEAPAEALAADSGGAEAPAPAADQPAAEAAKAKKK